MKYQTFFCAKTFRFSLTPYALFKSWGIHICMLFMTDFYGRKPTLETKDLRVGPCSNDTKTLISGDSSAKSPPLHHGFHPHLSNDATNAFHPHFYMMQQGIE